jgi:hypothetical protein
MAIRGLRDNIVHHGHTPEFVFTLPDGFALSLTNDMWSKLQTTLIWPEQLLKPNRLASMLALLVYLVDDMNDSMSELGVALSESFQQLPPAVASGYELLLRNHLVVHCNMLADYRTKHWFDSAAVMEECRRQWSASGIDRVANKNV